MRILQVSEAAGGGLLGVVSSLAGGLVEEGHEVAFAFGRRPETPADMRSVLPEGVEAIELPWGQRTLASHLRGGRALRKTIKAWKPDVVHLHSSFTGTIGHLVVPGDIPTIYSPHAYAFAGANRGAMARRVYRAAEWWTARRVDVVGAVSAAEAELARDALRAPRVVTIPNGIFELDPPGDTVDGFDHFERPLVVGMGRITPQHDPRENLQILEAVGDVADVCWIGGAPDGTGGALGAAGIPVTGWLRHEEACARLGEADVYLHWSAWDGQSISVLEAMARDVVVVASDIPANRELLGPGGVCATPEQAAALICDVIEDAELREEMIAQQRERRGHWAGHRMVADWLVLYKQLTGHGDRAYDDMRIGASRDRDAQFTASWS